MLRGVNNGVRWTNVAWVVAVAALGLAAKDPVRAAPVLIHEYTFTNGATDSVGSMNGTLIGGASIVGGVLNLDGVSGRVELGGYAVPTGSFSISFRAASSGQSSGFTEIISQGSSGAPGFYIGTNPGGNFRLGDLLLSTNVNYPYDGQFHDFALTSGVSGTKFYIDNSLVFSSLTVATAPASGTATIIGTQFSGISEFFRGQIDDLRIYSGEIAVSQTPLPAALPLFLSGLGVMGLLGWHRKKKPASASAPA
jgi:hypothetical protein